MKLYSLLFRTSLFVSAALLTSGLLASAVYAQQQGDSDSDAAVLAKFPAAKRRAAAEASSARSASQDAKKAVKPEKESADTIRKREAWFYKQRASANGHIPPGARGRALEHMQRMMVKEGKLVQRPDGSFAEVAPKSLLSPLGAVTNPWTSIGPNPTTGGTFSPVTGRITTIAVDPSDATGNTVLIGGAQGGIWRSTDAGATWTAVGDQNASLAMGSIAFAPSSPTTVYAGTGEQASVGFDIYYGAGVLKSTDSGQHWTQTCTTPSATCPFIGPYSDATPFGFFTLGGTRISYVAVNPANPSMVLVAAQTQFLQGPTEGVYCSSDGGSSWSIVSSASGEMSTFVGFASSTVAFAALGNPFGATTGTNGILKSTNANSCSLTFTALSGGLPTAATMGRIDLGISPLFATDNTVYASIADATAASGPNLGVWVTTNGGTSWTQTAAPDNCQQQCWYDNVVKVDPNGGAHAFLGGSAVTDSGGNPIWVLRTANTGAVWATIIPNTLGPGLPHVDNHAFAFVKIGTKVRMYLGNDGGIWRTDDAEAATVVWNNLNDSLLTLTQFYPAISVHPSSPGIAFAGAQDNGSQIYDQATTGTSWTDNGACGDGTGTAIDSVFPSTVFVACNGDNVAVSVTNGAANSFTGAGNGVNPSDFSNFVPPLTTDPSAANTAYLGTTKVYQTINAGLSWTALSGDLVNGASGDSLIALAVAPRNSAVSAVVYAGADTGQVFVATNVSAGTGTFNLVTGQASLPPRQVSAIAVDPADATGKTAYAAFSGFSFVQGTINDPKGHLFRTTDGGATWQDVSCTTGTCSSPGASDLPNTPVNDVVVDPDNPDTPGKTLYAATDIGVFQGTCVNATPTVCTWATLSTGLPRVAVLSLKLHHASRTLMAATHGRGTWSILLNNFTFPGPHISSLSPVSAAAGSAQFTLTVNGNGLTGGTVQWNGSALTTTVVSDTQLTATVPASMVSGAGAPPITVLAGGTSNALTFTVLGGPPTISSPVAPTSAPVNSAATMITVNGTGFSATSKVLMNPDVGGTSIATTFVSATQLTATVPATFMAGFGSTNSVGVQNPPPGGGTTVTTQTVTLPTFVVVAPAPANDNFASAVSITSTSFADTKDSSGATAQTSDPVPPCSQLAGFPPTGTVNTIWYKVAPTGTGMANIDTIGSSYDSVLSVWTGTSGAFTAVPNGCNDDINPGIVTQSQITNLTLNAGTTYFIMVSSFGALDPNPVAFGGKSVLNFSFTGTLGGGTTGSFTVGGSDVTVAAGSNATSTITVTPTGGFTGMVNVTCAAANLPPGVTCTPNPLAINVTGTTAVTGNLTVAVAAPSSTTSASILPTDRTVQWAGLPPITRGGKGWWGLSAITGFAAILLLLLPGRKRYRAALALGLICILSFTLGCSGGYGGGGGGTSATTTKISVTNAKVASGTSVAFTVTVTSTGSRTPTGSVQLYDGTAVLGTAGTLASGSTTINITSLAVGTHAISAHYLADTYSTASQSGVLNVAITGTTTFAITASPAASNGNATVNLTVN